MSLGDSTFLQRSSSYLSKIYFLDFLNSLLDTFADWFNGKFCGDSICNYATVLWSVLEGCLVAASGSCERPLE